MKNLCYLCSGRIDFKRGDFMVADFRYRIEKITRSNRGFYNFQIFCREVYEGLHHINYLRFGVVFVQNPTPLFGSSTRSVLVRRV